MRKTSLSVLLTTVLLSNLVPLSLTQNAAHAAKFSNGDTVRVSNPNGTNVRPTPGSQFEIVDDDYYWESTVEQGLFDGFAPPGVIGTITGGPTEAYYNGNIYIWWEVSFTAIYPNGIGDEKYKGYTIETSLELVDGENTEERNADDESSNDSYDITLDYETLKNATLAIGETTKAQIDQNFSGVSSTTLTPCVGFFFSKDTKYQQSSDQFLGESCSSFQGNEADSDLQSYEIRIPSVAGGNYYILFIADYKNEYSEKNEDNNLKYTPVAVTNGSDTNPPDSQNESNVEKEEDTEQKSPACGNGIIEGSEECDENNLNGESCTNEGYDYGDLQCTSLCRFSTKSCKKMEATYSIGDMVEVYNPGDAGTNVRKCASKNNTRCPEVTDSGYEGIAKNGITGEISASPQRDLSGYDYTWWKVDFGDYEGWVIENFLRKHEGDQGDENSEADIRDYEPEEDDTSDEPVVKDTTVDIEQRSTRLSKKLVQLLQIYQQHSILIQILQDETSSWRKQVLNVFIPENDSLESRVRSIETLNNELRRHFIEMNGLLAKGLKEDNPALIVKAEEQYDRAYRNIVPQVSKEISDIWSMNMGQMETGRDVMVEVAELPSEALDILCHLSTPLACKLTKVITVPSGILIKYASYDLDEAVQKILVDMLVDALVSSIISTEGIDTLSDAGKDNLIKSMSNIDGETIQKIIASPDFNEGVYQALRATGFLSEKFTKDVLSAILNDGLEQAGFQEVLHETRETIKDSAQEAVETTREKMIEGIETYDNAVRDTLDSIQEASRNGIETFEDTLRHWGKLYIEKVSSRGAINGKSANKFAPDDPITRAEALKITLELRRVNVPDQGLTCSFRDVGKDAWYYNYFAVGEMYGIINGINGKAYPNNNLTRAEALKLLALATGVDVAKYQGKGWFTDVLFSNWSSPYVAWAKEKGIVNGYGDGTFFKPDEAVTRAEFSKMAALAFGL